MIQPDPRSQILEAAERVFAERGYRGATIQALGRATGFSPALLYYYFGSKAGLYEAVLDQTLGRLAGAGLARVEEAATPADAIRALLATQAEGLLGHPATARLVLRELVDGAGEHLEPVVRTRLAALFQRLTALIAAGQAEGRFRPDLDPQLAAISTASQVAWFAVAAPVVTVLLGHARGEVSPALRAQVADHAAIFALSALESRAPMPESVP